MSNDDNLQEVYKKINESDLIWNKILKNKLKIKEIKK